MTIEALRTLEEGPAGEQISKPEAEATGSAYRASVTGKARPVWSCTHVHFTEHSARACAEEHLRTWPRSREAAATTRLLSSQELAPLAMKPGVLMTGGGYRAIITDATHKSWSCPHLHFTDHSARACAERLLRT